MTFVWASVSLQNGAGRFSKGTSGRLTVRGGPLHILRRPTMKTLVDEAQHDSLAGDQQQDPRRSPLQMSPAHFSLLKRQVEEKNSEAKVVLTKPLALDGDGDGNGNDVSDDYRPPNVAHLVLSLFKNVRPGSDLSRFKLPPEFNLPKSQLQCYGEAVYCYGNGMLSKCSHGETPLQRFTSVLAWSISTIRPSLFGVAPYNPIAGETHHVSNNNLHVLLEQVSHHPPVTALHATDQQHNIEIIWCQQPIPKFQGTCVEAEVQGKRQLKLLSRGETYLMNSPKLLIRFIPFPSVDWVGDVTIQCQQTGLQANLCYRSSLLLGRKARSIKGKVFVSSSSEKLYDIEGRWDRSVSLKDAKSKKVTVIYKAKEVLTGMKAPVVKDPKGIWGSESALVWSEVSQGIMSREWDKARKAKNKVEEAQRERKSRGEALVPRHFSISYTKESGYDCSPLEKWVPPAPIVVPQSSSPH